MGCNNGASEQLRKVMFFLKMQTYFDATFSCITIDYEVAQIGFVILHLPNGNMTI